VKKHILFIGLILLSIFIVGCENWPANYTRDNSVPKDELIVKCQQSYEECKEIAELKYALSITLIKTEKFEEKSKAEEFYRIWGLPLLMGPMDSPSFGLGGYDSKGHLLPIEDRFPIVLFAIKGGLYGPRVMICDRSGSLIKGSRIFMSCESIV